MSHLLRLIGEQRRFLIRSHRGDALVRLVSLPEPLCRLATLNRAPDPTIVRPEHVPHAVLRDRDPALRAPIRRVLRGNLAELLTTCRETRLRRHACCRC